MSEPQPFVVPLASQPNRRSQFLQWVRFLCPLLAIGALVYICIVASQDFPILFDKSIAISWGVLLLSEVFLFSFFILLIQGWRLILVRLDGSKLSFRTAFCVWWLSQSAHYVPGRILLWVSRYALVSPYGISFQTVSLSLVLEHVLLALGAVLVFVLFSLAHVANLLDYWLWVVIGTVGGSCIVLSPSFLQKAIDLWARLRKQPRIQLRLNWPDIILLSGFYILVWVVGGAGFVLLLASLIQIEPESWVLLVGIFPFAWLCGLLSIIAPGGLGVREAILGILLANFMPVPIATFVAISSRIWWMIVEGASFFIALLLKRFHRSPAQIHVS